MMKLASIFGGMPKFVGIFGFEVRVEAEPL